MRHDVRQASLNMFHQRLLLLLLIAMIVFGGLGMQVVRLTIVEGGERRRVAEASLDRVTYLPTYRGRILDRHGKVLAQDRAAYDLAVEYEVITGAWSVDQARNAARESAGRESWSVMHPGARRRLVEKYIPHFEREREALWSMICTYGNIERVELDRRLDEIKRRVESMAAVVHDRQRQEALEDYGHASDGFDFTPRPILEQESTHVVLDQLPDDVALEFNRFAQQRPDMLDVRDSHRRDYPWSTVEVVFDRSTLPKPMASDEHIRVPIIGVADHLLGRVRDGARAEDLDRRPFRNARSGEIDLGGYRNVNDEVGIRGLEAAFESTLRGGWGRVVDHVHTGEQERTEPEPGDDLQLTLDFMLQARIQAVLSPVVGLTRVQQWHQNDVVPLGTWLNSAVVVLDVETGDVLAAVTMPTLAMIDDMSEDEVQRRTPYVNRAVEAVYPPGSILKPLVLAAAVVEGEHGLHAPIECIGHYFATTKNAARCWIYREKWSFRTHGPLFAAEAIAKSCNIFFYTLADRLGAPRLLDWLRRFGLEQRLDTGAGWTHYTRDTGTGDVRSIELGESAGTLPTEARVATWAADGSLEFNTVIMGIGQGEMTWTPMHAANAYATLARGGSTRDATFMPDALHRTGPPRDDTPLSPELVAVTLDGLRQAVNEGTGHHITFADEDQERIIRAPGVSVWAKTGTAQAPPFVLGDLDGDGVIDRSESSVEVLRGCDHSWFVGLVGPRDTDLPMYAIAVLVEYGGSGGRVAGPVADQVIRALQAEGYLPDA